MLHTIEVEIDQNGHIHPLEPLPFRSSGRAYLTLLNSGSDTSDKGSGLRALRLLASPRYANRPKADPEEVMNRIEALRNDWGDR